MFVGENGSVIRPDIMLFAILISYISGLNPYIKQRTFAFLPASLWFGQVDCHVSVHGPLIVTTPIRILTLAVFSPPNQDLREF